MNDQSSNQNTHGAVDTLFCQCGTESKRPAQLPGNPTRRAFECNTCSQERRERKFTKSICPPLYLDSDPARLPTAQLNRAMSWNFGPRGLLLCGETGKGKTRIAWQLLRRVLIRDFPEVGFTWFDCVGFGHEIERHYKSEDFADWILSVAKKDIIFFDDLGKLKLTERAETELFGLIERRCAYQLPIIATTNDTGDSFAARMTENRAEPMVRRLSEFCHVIQF